MSQSQAGVDLPSVPLTTFLSRFYQAELDSIPASMSELLSQYCHISPDEQVAHVLTLRDKAYKAYPYPCLGRFRFLDLDLSSYPTYGTYILPTMTSESDSKVKPILLDLGTCLGQDIRKLIHDGVSPTQIYGSDIVPAFIDYGYELFRDEHVIPRDHFLVPGDVLATPEAHCQSDQLSLLDDKVDILHITAVFHLFGLEAQKKIASRCLRLLRKNSGKPVLVLGGQAGNLDAREMSRSDGSKAYRHNVDSWRKLWEGVVTDRENGWSEKVKKLTVEGLLEDRGGNHGTRNKDDQKEPVNQQKEEGRSKVIGQAEEGFRWHVFWVWVEFF